MVKHFNFDVRTWTLPHWLCVLGGTVFGASAGAVTSYLQAIPGPELFQDITTTKGLLSLAYGALSVGVLTAITTAGGVAMQMSSARAQDVINRLKKGSPE